MIVQSMSHRALIPSRDKGQISQHIHTSYLPLSIPGADSRTLRKTARVRAVPVDHQQ